MNPLPAPLCDLVPLVQTSRLRIDSLRPECFDAYCEIVCHEDTGRFDDEFPKSLDAADESFQESMEREPFSSEGWNEYGVFTEQGDLVGVVSHCERLCEDGLVRSRMGYHFHPDRQGKGYATEAVRALLTTLFEQGSHEVECVVHPLNERSIALLCRLDFRQVSFDPRANEELYAASAKLL